MSNRSPNQTDVHIGKRMKMQRMACDLSQTDVANRLGITFQQIQKYERGTNRIGPGRLQELANLLGVSPVFFFEDGPRFGKGKSTDKQATTDLLSKKDGLELAQAFDRIQSRSVRRQVVDFVRQLANGY
jgi:transcriptional regulator with XRE-family HTH domain